jgi:hypothetical protein
LTPENTETCLALSVGAEGPNSGAQLFYWWQIKSGIIAKHVLILESFFFYGELAIYLADGRARID